jgi:O-antigen/teichoic acid export membrane protein
MIKYCNNRIFPKYISTLPIKFPVYWKQNNKSDGLRAKLVQSGIGSVVIQTFNRISALVMGLILARMLGVEGYGVYAYAFAVMSLLMVVAEAGVPTLLMRETAASCGRKEWGLLKGALSRSVQFVSFTSTGVVLIGLTVLWWRSHYLSSTAFYTMLFMLFLLPFAALTKITAHAIRGLQQILFSQVVELLLRPLLVLLIVSSVFICFPALRKPQYAMSFQLFSAVISLGVAIWFLNRILPQKIKTSPSQYRNRRWLKSALPFTLIGGAGIINSQTDIIMLGWIKSAEQVGIYRAAIQGALLTVFGLQAVNTVIAPQFARLYAKGDMAHLQQLVTESARMILLTALPIAFILIFAGDFIVVLLFGADFSASNTPLVILTVGQLTNVFFGSVGYLLNMTGYEKDTARSLWMTAVLNVLLNLILIPKFGINGAAIATSLSTAAWNMLLNHFVRRRLSINSTALGFV